MLRVPKVILLIESSRASGRALLRGMADYSHHHGPWSFSWEPAGLEKVQPLLETGEADGIILRDVAGAEEIMAYGLPTVVVGHRKTEIPGLVNVVTDSEAIGRMGAEHLLGCGFKHFAFCGYVKTPLENTTWAEMRREFFCNGSGKRALTIRRITPCQRSQRTGPRSGVHWPVAGVAAQTPA